MSKPNLVVLLILLALLAGCGGEAPEAPADDTAHALALQEGERPFGGFAIASAQPSEARVREVAPEVARVVSFRAPDEDWKGKPRYDEAVAVTEAGGVFERIPVTKETIRDADVRKRAYAAFEAAAGEPAKLTWFHCSSSNRVGALWALYRAEVEGKPTEEAIADGKAVGLKKLEPAVREILGAQ